MDKRVLQLGVAVHIMHSTVLELEDAQSTTDKTVPQLEGALNTTDRTVLHLAGVPITIDRTVLQLAGGLNLDLVAWSQASLCLSFSAAMAPTVEQGITGSARRWMEYIGLYGSNRDQ
jgi:hypothetical protein